MEVKKEDIEVLKNTRVNQLQRMLLDEKRQLLKKVNRHNQTILNSKKYKNYKKIIQQRILYSDNYIKNINEIFFTMLCDNQYLLLTTQIDIFDKLQKYKKNILNSLQKIIQGIEQKQQLRVEKGRENDQDDNDEQEEMGNEEVQQRGDDKKQRYRGKSKNYKISTDATCAMMEWLLINFQNPYPSNQEKQEMARKGKISMVKVNNWFINARERTVKGYFMKDG